MSTALEPEIDETEEVVNSLVDETLPPVDGAADLSDDEPDGDKPGESDATVTAADPPNPRLEKLLAEIAEAEMLCANAEEAVNEAKAVLKEAKVEYDGCVLKLRRLAKAVRNDEDRPLFDSIKDAEADAGDEEPEDDGDYTAALKESIDVLNLPAGVVKKLAEENVHTVGDLEQLREHITLGRKQWPKGIGPAKVDVIETAVVEWLAERCQDGTAEPEVDFDKLDTADEEIGAEDLDDEDDEETGTQW